MVELGKTPRCFLPHSGACSLPKHNSALQNASVSQNSRQARKCAAFILAVETGRGRWIPEIEAAWFTEWAPCQVLHQILSSSKPVWDTAGKLNTLVFSSLSNLMLATYVAVSFGLTPPVMMSLTVVNCACAKTHAHQQNKGGIPVLPSHLEGCWQGYIKVGCMGPACVPH